MGQIKKILLSGSAPQATSFKTDDIVINPVDGKAYIKNTSNTVIELGSNAGGGSGGGASSPLVTADVKDTYITSFRNTGSAVEPNDQQASLVVLDLDTTDNANRVHRMTLDTFLSQSYVYETLDVLYQISASQASGALVNGVFFPNGLGMDLDQNGNVGTGDLLLLLAAYGNTTTGKITPDKDFYLDQLASVYGIHQGYSISSSQFITGGLDMDFLVATSITASSITASGTIYALTGSFNYLDVSLIDGGTF